MPIDLDAARRKIATRLETNCQGNRAHSSSIEELFPPERIEQIKRKELRRFKQAQGKKWRKWLDAVSE